MGPLCKVLGVKGLRSGCSRLRTQDFVQFVLMTFAWLSGILYQGVASPNQKLEPKWYATSMLYILYIYIHTHEWYGPP